MNNELYFKICRFFKQKKLDDQPFRCREIFCPLDLDPNIFADPDPGDIWIRIQEAQMLRIQQIRILRTDGN